MVPDKPTDEHLQQMLKKLHTHSILLFRSALTQEKNRGTLWYKDSDLQTSNGLRYEPEVNETYESGECLRLQCASNRLQWGSTMRRWWRHNQCLNVPAANFWDRTKKMRHADTYLNMRTDHEHNIRHYALRVNFKSVLDSAQAGKEFERNSITDIERQHILFRIGTILAATKRRQSLLDVEHAHSDLEVAEMTRYSDEAKTSRLLTRLP